MVALKALGLWAVILVLAIVNGFLREAVLLKMLARSTAFTVSGVLLIVCVLAVALLSIRWLGRRSFAQYAGIGLLWLLLTLAFEFGFGLLVRGESLASLAAAYRFEEGNIWPIVLVVVAAAPAFAAYARGGADFAGDRMHWLELKVPPLLVWLVSAVAMAGAANLLPALSFALPARLALALVLVALGAAVALAGVVAFRRKRTTVNPLTPGASSSVVSGGVYRVSRNPMYLGFLLALAGWALYLANAAAALLLPAFVAYMTRYQIKPEERALLAKFGSEFAQYAARVRRWV